MTGRDVEAVLSSIWNGTAKVLYYGLVVPLVFTLGLLFGLMKAVASTQSRKNRRRR